MHIYIYISIIKSCVRLFYYIMHLINVAIHVHVYVTQFLSKYNLPLTNVEGV